EDTEDADHEGDEVTEALDLLLGRGGVDRLLINIADDPGGDEDEEAVDARHDGGKWRRDEESGQPRHSRVVSQLGGHLRHDSVRMYLHSGHEDTGAGENDNEGEIND